MSWQPTTLTRFIQGFPSSARTALVETDTGLGYLKAMGGPEGPHTLASEVVATQLAEWFGLSTFDWAILELDEIDEVPFLDSQGNQTGMAVPGPAFITRSESGSTWSGGKRELKMLANPDDISRLVVFDTWVLNCDRHSLPKNDPMGRPRINRDNVFLSTDAPHGQFALKAMDHTHCFTCGREWSRRLSNLETVRDNRLFGCFPEFRSFLNRSAVVKAAADLKRLERAVVATMTAQIPVEWEVAQPALDALVELVFQRAHFVADSIECKLWPQGDLFADTAEEPET
ncbi:HipA family kinase [Maioricimonas sp. JC845]|uniref:HipA family kinase n=1 Tax=Maioricimonas sp. JC845 TaxID=3232138 RepID=UPI003457FA1C